jgi:two-component system, NarL family, sensor kinase
MKKYLPVILFLIFTFGKSLVAQQHLVDSITMELQQTMADTARAISMMRLAIDYEVVDTAKAFKAYRDAIMFGLEKNLDYQLGRIYHNQSFLFSVAGNFEESKASLEKAINYYQKTKNPKGKKFEASAYGDIANIYKNQNDLEHSIQYHLKCISIFEQLGLEEELVIRYCNLASLFGDYRDFGKQKEYAIKALSSAKKTGSRLNLNMAYFILAHSSVLLEDYNLAKIYIDSSKLYFNENSNIDILFSYYLITAQVYRKLDQLDSSFYYFEKCFKASEKYSYSYGKAESQLQMGAVAILQKKYPLAEKYLTAGIKEAETLNYFNILDEGYKYLSDIYAVTGRYKPAYEYFQKYKDMNDSVVNMDSKKYASDLEKKYETEKKESIIHHLEVEKKLQELSLQKKNIFNYFLIAGIFAILIISLLYYRNFRQKQKTQQQLIYRLETEKQLAAAEAVLKGEDQERTRLAKDLHDGLGGMLSGIKYSFTTMKGNLIMTPDNQQAFERSIDMLDSSIMELRRVAHNMMPEALLRFGLDTALKDFCNEINQSGALKVTYQSIGLEGFAIDQTTAVSLYRIVQELLNNVMKHARATSAIVQLTKLNEQLSITVEDDGKGFDTGLLAGSKGIGWINIRNRVELLKGKLDITSRESVGTSVQIELTLNS